MRVALAEELGGIDSVELSERPAPAPAAGQALVRVHGEGVGLWDAGFLGGGFPGLALPFVPGQEVAESSKRPATGPASSRASGCTRACSRRVAGSLNWRWPRPTAWPPCPARRVSPRRPGW